MNFLSRATILPLSLIFALLFVQAGLGQTTTFAYQGNLQFSGQPANGNFDFEFALFDAASAGNQLGTTQTINTVAVANGVFAVTLNFGSVFTGAARFLEIRVRPASGGAYTLLAPRQPVASAPYAVRSVSAANSDASLNATNLNNQPASFYTNAGNLSSGTLPSARFAGTYAQAVTLSNTSNSYAGSGSALTALDANNISAGTISDARLSGNVPLESGINNFTNTNSFNFGTKALQIRNDTGLVPGFNLTGSGSNLGILRLRNALEIWPSDDAARSGNLDIRNSAGNATISLNGSNGNITATGNINGANTPAIKVAQTFRDARTLGPNRITIQDSFQNLETLTVNVPAQGYLLLTATANIASVWVSSAGGLQVIKGHLKIEETTSGSPVQLVEHSSYLIPITTVSVNQAADVVTVSWVVPVASAGQRIFRSAITVEGGMYIYTTTLSAQYFPNTM